MPIPRRTKFASIVEDYEVLVTDDGSFTLVERATEDSFHSGCGALTETRHVYLNNSEVEHLLANGNACVLEVGLGTAMALMLTIDRAIEHQASLEYAALENRWLPASVLTNLRPETWGVREEILNEYMKWRSHYEDNPLEGTYHWHLDAKRHIQIIVGDARDWTPPQPQSFDVVYFDPFAPSSAPDLWCPEMFATMHQAVKPEGKMVTYCVNRQVRDNLTSVGFDVRRVPGPAGGKREVLVAVKRREDG